MSTLNTTNLKNPSSASNNIVLDSSGRVLVGTSSTSSNTTILAQGNSGGGAAGVIRITSTASSPANGDDLGVVAFGDSAHGTNATIFASRDGGTWSASSKPSRLVFSTTADGAASPTERMRIDSSGNLLFNTTSIIDASNFSAVIKTLTNFATIKAPDTNTYMAFQFQNNSGTRVGYIQFTTTATTFSTSSDYRLKENIVVVNDGITRLQQLKPRRFNFIVDPDHTVDDVILSGELSA